MASSFKANSFYSKNKSKRSLELEEKLERGESDLKRRPLPPLLQSSLQGHPVDWKVFVKQEDALNYAKERGSGLMTFAFEEQVPGSQGSRRYMVTHPTHMWKIHIGRPANERCTYEVIPHESMCKLYFDLEFSKEANPDSNGEKMVEILLKASLWAFQEVFELTVTNPQVLVLDGSTPKKFSQHLIYQSSEYAFQDNINAGNFVRFLVSQLKENKIPALSEAEQQSLFVENDKGEPVCFCDLAVYTKNRNFRLFLSTKFGKNVPLTVAKTNGHQPKVINPVDWPSKDAAIFSSSLITFFQRPVTQMLTYCASEEELNINKTLKSSEDPSFNGYKMSPWSEIDQFIANLIAPGTIRQWIYYEKTETIVYLIQGSRYCASIGRDHKRNHIKYVVNLPNATYYQSCFDPDCAHSRPPPQPIPPEHLPWRNMMDDPCESV